jgi:ubiquinone/menaquinone biosynthesis C-methylase UbiE
VSSTQYTTDDNLAKRFAIHRYTDNPIPWADWYVSLVKIPSGSRIADIGCGDGANWKGHESLVDAESTIDMIDLSPGMVKAAQSNLSGVSGNWHFSVADVVDLPFSDDTFDVVMANHMLYHATDVERAVAELARITKPGGIFLASTVGSRHMRQIREWAEAVALETLSDFSDVVKRFGLVSGVDILKRHFADVRIHLYPGRLLVPSVEPVLDYIASMELVDSPENTKRFDDLRRLLERELATHGRITIDKETGVFDARGV